KALRRCEEANRYRAQSIARRRPFCSIRRLSKERWRASAARPAQNQVGGRESAAAGSADGAIAPDHERRKDRRAAANSERSSSDSSKGNVHARESRQATEMDGGLQSSCIRARRPGPKPRAVEGIPEFSRPTGVDAKA